MFRLIAIKTGVRPHKLVRENGIYPDFNKVLKDNTIYPLLNEFKFLNKNSLVSFNKKSDRNNNLYNIKSHDHLTINIHAIVGENGSGKSSLIELIYVACFNIGCKINLLRFEKGKEQIIFNSLDLEILYESSEKGLQCIQFLNGEVVTFNYSKQGSLYKRDYNSSKDLSTRQELRSLFYSLVVNYSHYALNTDEVGFWIHSLFHKNDGYQTPMVLNPRRTKGDFNINHQKKLLNRRLQANLIQDVRDPLNLSDSLRNLANDKIADRFRLTFNKDYFKSDRYKNVDVGNIPNSDVLELLERLQIVFGIEVSMKKYIQGRNLFNQNNNVFSAKDEENLFYFYLITYIYHKFYRVKSDYSTYKNFKGTIVGHLTKLKESESHIAFKIKGAILYLKYYKDILGSLEEITSKKKTLTLEHLNKEFHRIEKLEKEDKFRVNTTMLQL